MKSGDSIGLGCYPVVPTTAPYIGRKGSSKVYEVQGGINLTHHLDSEDCSTPGINATHLKLPFTYFHETCEKVTAGHAEFYSKSDKDSSFHIMTEAVDVVRYIDYKPDKCKTAFDHAFYHPSEECSKEWNSKLIFDGEELIQISFSKGNCTGDKTTKTLGKAGCHDDKSCKTEYCGLHVGVRDRRKKNAVVVDAAISNKSPNGIIFAALLLLLIN